MYTRGRENRAITVEQTRQGADQAGSGLARGGRGALEQRRYKSDLFAEELVAAPGFPACPETDRVLSLGNKMKFLHKKN